VTTVPDVLLVAGVGVVEDGVVEGVAAATLGVKGFGPVMDAGCRKISPGPPLAVGEFDPPPDKIRINATISTIAVMPISKRLARDFHHLGRSGR
jgi:hypothetical protein